MPGLIHRSGVYLCICVCVWCVCVCVCMCVCVKGEYFCTISDTVYIIHDNNYYVI